MRTGERERTALANSAFLFLSVVPLLGCAVPPSPEARLYDEIRCLAEDPSLRRAVLQQAVFLAEPQLVQVGLDYMNDADPVVRLLAHKLVCADHVLGASAVASGLSDDDWLIRRFCAIQAGTSQLDDVHVDSELERLIRHEIVGPTLTAACVSYVKRRGKAAALFVHRVLRERGAGWELSGVEALAMNPQPEFVDVFRRALEDAGCVVFGRRGLAALGMLDNDRWMADMRAFGREMTNAEYREEYLRISDNRGAVRASTWAEFSREASGASVVIIGESHMSGFMFAWQVAILQELRYRWKHELVLIHESTALNKVIMTATQELGGKLAAIERERTREEMVTDRHHTGWLIERRDEEAVSTLLQMVLDNEEQRFVVVYGSYHTERFASALRGEGVPVVVINVTGTKKMRSDAMRLCGTMETAGKLFRYEDGTYYLSASPFSEAYRCPELDAALAARNREQQ